MITGGFPVIPSCFQFSKFNKIVLKILNSSIIMINIFKKSLKIKKSLRFFLYLFSWKF